MAMLDETDIPDLMEITCYKNRFPSFSPSGTLSVDAFREIMVRLYELRCKIAHVRRTFTALDLDMLIDMAKSLLPMMGSKANELREVLDCLDRNPEKVVVKIPVTFLTDEDERPSFPIPINLPSADYDPDGGFIGRKEDLAKLETLLLGDLHRVITISGAGGVGKTALAHRLCNKVLEKKEIPFDALVWVSAKEEQLTVTGIEPIEPTLTNYESLLDTILETVEWADYLDTPVEKREANVDVILRANQRGILLVVDNLETIQDDRVKEFIKDFPAPSKVLITSRLGLGEVERRQPLKEMSVKDAVTLLRTVAREKGAESLAQLPEDVLSKYVDRMSRYPLAIKWVVGQVALGKDVDVALGHLMASTGDVARFCFEHIFDMLLKDDSRTVLYALAAYDKPMTRGVLSHVSNLGAEQLEPALTDLTLASLIIPTQRKSAEAVIETRYELLPLTRNYIQSKLRARSEIHRAIKARIEAVQNLIEEATRVGRQYRYSLRDMGAESEEEKIAAMWVNTARQKYDGGNYDGAVDAFEKAAQIAPRFAGVYSRWGVMESDAGFLEKADDLMKKAAKLAPEDSRVWFTWGNLEKRRQRFDRAYNYLGKALQLSPDDPFILGALGEVEKRRGNFENADDILRRALRLRPPGVLLGRHEVVCCTSLADNLRRWAEALHRDKRTDEAVKRLKEGYEYALEATKIAKGEIRAEDALREVALDLGIHLKCVSGMDVARPYLEQAIVQSPRRAKEKKMTAIACYHLASMLLTERQRDEARRYYSLGRRSLMDRSGYTESYKALALELMHDRVTGVLNRVVEGRGFGFLEPDARTGESVFLHISQVVPKPSTEEFENMQGGKFSFMVVQTSRGAEAQSARLVEDELA